jgi:hypothetical protein
MPGLLHFATIVTPEVEPERRDALLDVMRKYFAERNSRQMVPSAQMRASGKTQYGRSMFMVHRQWELHVWELTGAPSTWGAQLDKDFAQTPVLAVVSGLGHHWAPIHEFCEKKRLACLFPNAEVPVDARDNFYELYLSRGVLLEADLMGSALAGPSDHAPPRLVHQVYRGTRPCPLRAATWPPPFARSRRPMHWCCGCARAIWPHSVMPARRRRPSTCRG